MKKFFLSFASSNMRKSLRRIGQQAVEMDFFDEVVLCDESALDQAFREKYRQKLRFGVRGFGYWCWKPQLVHQVLRDMEEGDLLLYVDAGCHLNRSGRWRLEEYFEMAASALSGIVAFQAKAPTPPLEYDGRPLLDLTEFKWVKGDTIDYFGVRDRPEIMTTATIGATIFLLRKSTQADEIIRRWQETIEADFALLDDSPSQSENFNGFIEHRHDQAILSIICKLSNVETISSYEYWYPDKDGRKPDWLPLTKFPIQARRDKQFDAIHKLRKELGKITRGKPFHRILGRFS